ncbi:alpha/beta hydrolase-fold protein [Thalassotalea sp. 1_MG-2023]|uniref:alpha/beta hydrolase-fold protein n=1 Tax=Thalassotalea sp. 1_MG-2023 TaxID=3062680 RepID=UPI0026E314D8|nr:alpha/beta hydrolase-fold protein [Thalassotalea sp. 1_MG-2023]MDO6427938.1 alpha/beta hydrolase-fold protein [Thalassotalea sp. 1_MG-2023]
MKISSKVHALIVTCLLSVATSANSNTTTGMPLTYGNTLNFKSDIIEEKIPLNIYLPANFDTVSKEFRYPVIFINGSHGNRFFHTLTGVVKHLVSVDRMPDSIVVSLNYSGHFPDTYTNGMWPKREVISGYGDAKKYQAMLEQELFPYLEKHYRAMNKRSIIGVSGSSLFPLYSIDSNPALFDNYIFLAASDMLGMSFNEETKRPFSETIPKQLVNELTGLVLFAVADDDLAGKPDYINNNKAVLESYQKLPNKQGKLITHVFDNERHYDAFIKTLLLAFDTLYPESLWAPKYRELVAQKGDALTNIDNYYQKISQHTGFSVLPNPMRWNSVNSLQFIVRHLIELERLDEAQSVALRLVEYTPEQVESYLALAQVYEKLNKLTLALDTLATAKVIANNTEHWQLEDIIQSIARLTALQH